MNAELESKFQGAIVGLAVGDALGRPTEFIRNMEHLREKFGPDGVTDFEADRHPAGTYTDDTQMSLCVARALIKAGHRSLDELMQEMSREFVTWSRSPENNRSPGCTCMAGCKNLERGIPWQNAGIADSKGCGSAMRSMPIGLYCYDEEERLIEIARASSLPTHGHPTALASTAAAALLTAWAVRGEDPSEYPGRLANVMETMDGGADVARLVRPIPDWLGEPPETVLCHGKLGEAWVGDEAVASALYCFCRSPKDFRKTVLAAANTVGDSDSIACIAGAFSGAYNGLNAIPERWRCGVENQKYLHDIGTGLLQARER